MKKIMRKMLLILTTAFILLGITKSCIYAADTIQIKEVLEDI